MTRSIIQHPHPALRTKCLPVFDFSEVRSIVGQMRAVLNQPWQSKCIGFAANQVGIFKRVIMVEQGTQWLTLVNPVLVRAEGEQIVRDGCMSIDYGNTFHRRTRPAFIQVEYFDEHGTACRRKAKGIHAAAIAHEIDHLEGVLFIDGIEGAG